MKNNKIFHAEWQLDHWAIWDPSYPNSTVNVDGLTMHIISRSGDICKGYILAVHGLPQEFAAWADRMTLNELGVGLNRVTHIPGTREILSLGAEGKISKGLPS